MNGKTFDYVINDLTDVPIAASLQGECETVQVFNLFQNLSF